MLYEKLETYGWISKNGISRAEQLNAKRLILEIRNTIRDLESTHEYGLYVLKTHPIIEEYKRINQRNKEISFVRTQPQLTPDEVRKNELTERFMHIASEYVHVENYSIKVRRLVCTNCDSVELIPLMGSETLYVCDICHAETEMLNEKPSFSDTERINMSSRYIYTKLGHFISAIKKYQGTQNVDPGKIGNVVEILKSQMHLHNLTSKTVTKEQLYMFLSEGNKEDRLSDYYEDIHLIYHIITDKPCQDIGIHEEELISMFVQFEDAYLHVKDPERKNSLNVYYKLYKFLQRLGVNVGKSDFFMLKTEAKEKDHDEKMKEAWDILGWGWIDTF